MNKSDLIVDKNPKSMFSESIRTIRTNLSFTKFSDKDKIILITSPEAGDGKSFISSNLALSYANEDKKVLLIDADLRKGRQHEVFELKNSENGGYSNMIINCKGKNHPEYILKTKYKNLDLLPKGPTPPNPVELLESENNKKILDTLKEKYDIIILDCAPVLGLSDSLVLAKISNINILVVSEGKTKMDNLIQAKDSFTKINLKINGIILNKSTKYKKGYYGYYGHYGYYGEEK